MKSDYKIQTPENIQKTIRRKSMVNWIIFIVLLALITVGILELINFTTK